MKIRWDLFRHFAIGMGSITLWPELPEYVETDLEALSSDWKNVGEDIRRSFKRPADTLERVLRNE